METATYTQVRKNFDRIMDRVCDDHVPIIITRQNEHPVVMVSLQDYNGIPMKLEGTGFQSFEIYR